jgi:hypothetical protein
MCAENIIVAMLSARLMLNVLVVFRYEVAQMTLCRKRFQEIKLRAHLQLD